MIHTALGFTLTVEVSIMQKERMYKDTKTWNPFVGCGYGCIYCKPSFQKVVAWSGRLRDCQECQTFEPHEHPERLVRIQSDNTVFVCGDGDITFASKEFMERVFEAMRRDEKKGRRWLVQSKNPSCLNQYLSLLPENTYLLTTLETNRNDAYEKYSKSPKPSVRCHDFLDLNWDKKIVTIEPIMDFDLDIFSSWLISIKPKAVFIGYNSHPKAVPLPEPSWDMVLSLWRILRRNGIRVLPKEMRREYILKQAYRAYKEVKDNAKVI